MTATTNSRPSIILSLLVPAFLVVAGVAVVMAMGNQQPKQIERGGTDPISILARLPIVSVQPIQSYDGIETLDIEVMGTVVPYRQVSLAAEVAGRVKFKSQECRIGRFVHKGDVLFQIDDKDFQLEVERLAALRDAEYAQQSELDQELANARKSLVLAEEELSIQELELKRLLTLPSGITSLSELDQARKSKLASANQKLSIQNQIQMIDTRRTRIVLAERLAATQLEQAKLNLERTQVRSPISGVIVNETVQEDSYVQKGATLCMIEDTERVEVSCNLRSDQLLMLLDQKPRSSDAIESPPAGRVMKSSSYELPKTDVVISYRVAGRDLEVYQWHGHVSRYEGIGLDSQSRTVPIRITVDAPEEAYWNGKRLEKESNGGLPALVRGMFVDCSIKTRPNRSLVLVPKLALRPGNLVWQFIQDDSVLHTEKNGSDPADSATHFVTPKSKLNLSDWAAGRVRQLTDVQMIGSIKIRQKEEYWIVEARDDLSPGLLTITTPLSNLIGDGSDKVRYPKKKGE